MGRGSGDKGLKPMGSIAAAVVVSDILDAFAAARVRWTFSPFDLAHDMLDKLETIPAVKVKAWTAMVIDGCQASTTAHIIDRSEDCVYDYIRAVQDSGAFPPDILRTLKS